MRVDPFADDPDGLAERLWRSSVFQGPLLLLAGAGIGLVSAGVAFALPLRLWPLHDSSTLVWWLAAGGPVVPALVSGAVGGILLGLRPIVRWWLILPVMVVGAVLGSAWGGHYIALMREGCLLGTGPQDPWCPGGGSPATFGWVAAYHASVGAVLGLWFGLLGLRPRGPSSGRRPLSARPSGAPRAGSE